MVLDWFFFWDDSIELQIPGPLEAPRDLRWQSTASSITFLWHEPGSWGNDGGSSANRKYQYQVYDGSAAVWGRTITLPESTQSRVITTVRASGHPQGRPIAPGDDVRFRVRTRNAIAEVSAWEEITGSARAGIPDDVLTWRGLPVFWRKDELSWR